MDLWGSLHWERGSECPMDQVVQPKRMGVELRTRFSPIEWRSRALKPKRDRIVPKYDLIALFERALQPYDRNGIGAKKRKRSKALCR